MQLFTKWQSIFQSLTHLSAEHQGKKGYVGNTSTLLHISKVEPDTQEMVRMRNKGALKESSMVCIGERTSSLNSLAKISNKALYTFCSILDYYLRY